MSATACDTGVAKLLIRIPGLAELIASRMVSLRRQVARVSLGSDTELLCTLLSVSITEV